jgi:transposase-like protein
MSVSEICRQHGISQPTFFSWKKKFSGMDATTLKCLKELEAENARLNECLQLFTTPIQLRHFNILLFSTNHNL